MQNNVVIKKEPKTEEVKEKTKTSTLKSKLQEIPFIKKLRTIKHLDYIVVGVLVIILLFILFSGSLKLGGNKKDSTEIKYISMEDYSTYMENKLSNALKDIEGVGKVKVMINFESGYEKIPAYSKDIVSDSRHENKGDNSLLESTSKENSSPIVVGGEVLVLKEVCPKPLSAIVIAEGGGDGKVKYLLTMATKTILDISTEKIEIFSMNT